MEKNSQFDEKNDCSEQFLKIENNQHIDFNPTAYEQDTVNTNFVENPENCILSGDSISVYETINIVSTSESELESSSQVASSSVSPTDTDYGSYAADDEKSNSEISPTYTEDDTTSLVKDNLIEIVDKDCLNSLQKEDVCTTNSPPEQDPNQQSPIKCLEDEILPSYEDDRESSSPLIGVKRKKKSIFNDIESDDGLQNPSADELQVDIEKVVEDDEEGSSDVIEHLNSSQSKGKCFISDFDKMMQKKHKERQRGRKRSNEFITDNDDLIDQLINRMEDAAYTDRRLNARGKPAINKVSMLKYVMSQLIKKDLQGIFLEHNILGALTEWLLPLPSKCLPCLPVRESILRLLEDFPPISTRLLKYSGIGKAVIYLRDHPDETKDNRERCSQLVMMWARPIHDLSCDYKTMSKEERQQRDYEMSLRYRKQKENGISINKKIKVDSLDQALSNTTDCEAIGPGDPGWIPRARVPQPSTRDYIKRPKSQLQCVSISTTKPNRYEMMAKKYLKAKRTLKTQRSGGSLSILGQKM